MRFIEILPFEHIHVLVHTWQSLQHEQSVVIINHFVDCLDLRLCHILLPELKHFSLISGSDDEAVEDEQHEQESRETSPRQESLRDAEEDHRNIQCR